MEQLDDGSPRTRKRWNWDDLHKSSQPSQSHPSPVPSTSEGKRKQPDTSTSDDEHITFKREK
jgi:hypothetical protein